jgi:hypothetical protein
MTAEVVAAPLTVREAERAVEEALAGIKVHKPGWSDSASVWLQRLLQQDQQAAALNRATHAAASLQLSWDRSCAICSAMLIPGVSSQMTLAPASLSSAATAWRAQARARSPSASWMVTRAYRSHWGVHAPESLCWHRFRLLRCGVPRGGFHPIGAITARSGGCQGSGPQDFQDALAVRRPGGRSGVWMRRWRGQSILEPLTGSRGGLITGAPGKGHPPVPIHRPRTYGAPVIEYRKRRGNTNEAVI